MDEKSPSEKQALPDQDLLGQLRQTYAAKKLDADFEHEKDFYTKLLPELSHKLKGAGYSLSRPLGLGSSASVWIVHHQELDQDRALKLPRPIVAKLKDLLPVVRGERERLASVNHQNVIRIYGSGEIRFTVKKESYVFPYFIMEYLDPVDDFDTAILRNHRSLTAAALITYFRDALTGLAVLHSESIVHCDVKPGNLLISPRKPALVADLGYAKYIPKYADDPKVTEVRFTPQYAHPDLYRSLVSTSDPNANVGRPPRSTLRPAFDLFAFGRSMQEVLTGLRAAESGLPVREDGKPSILTDYQWNYLSIISKRLLDGIVQRRLGDVLQSDLIPGLGDREMVDIKYNSADEAIEDFDKLLHLYDLEGQVPELSSHLSNYTQIPECKVPLTDRVRDIIDHPAFARLTHVTQLGFVSAVYRGSTHSRAEHVCGTFTRCCDYIRALWYDDENCLFQSIMSKKDLELGIVSALLHDAAQYPMAHDLTEISDCFGHEELTAQIIMRLYQGCEFTLGQVLDSAWKVNIDDVLSVLDPSDASSVRHRILHSIISGPIDCDKLDYVCRDSVHLGLHFGSAIDQERLLRNLTVAYKSSVVDDGSGVLREVMEFAEIGVREKALVVAGALLQARKDMFTQVYWQHTTRAMKAMLAFVVRGILIRHGESQKDKEAFWEAFFGEVFSPWFHQSLQPDSHLRQPTATIDLEGDLNGPSQYEGFGPAVSCSRLLGGDDCLLLFLRRFTDEGGARMIDAIRSRRLYKRVAVLSGSRNSERLTTSQQERQKATHKAIYERFRSYRLDNEVSKIESVRLQWERELIRRLIEKCRSDASVLPGGQSADQLNIELNNVNPLILVDIPVKGTRRQPGSQRLWYLPEDSIGVHSQDKVPVPTFEAAHIDLGDQEFDAQVGKIRVLVHPEYRDLILKALKQSEVVSVLST